MRFRKLTIVGSSQTTVEAYPLGDALRAFERVESGTARFRAVLTP